MPHYLGMVVGHERFWAGTHAYSDRTSYGCSTAPRALPCIIPDITYLHLCHTFRWSSFCTNPTSRLKGTSSKPVPKGSKTSLGSWSETRLFPLSRVVTRLCQCVMGCLVANFDLWDVTFDTWHLRSPVVTICISWPDKSCMEPPTLCCTHYQPS